MLLRDCDLRPHIIWVSILEAIKKLGVFAQRHARSKFILQAVLRCCGDRVTKGSNRLG